MKYGKPEKNLGVHDIQLSDMSRREGKTEWDVTVYNMYVLTYIFSQKHNS